MDKMWNDIFATYHRTFDNFLAPTLQAFELLIKVLITTLLYAFEPFIGLLNNAFAADLRAVEIYWLPCCLPLNH